jgi:SsrA-binding protein
MKNVEIKNRKATFEYEFVDTYEAGIILTGTEVKSVKKAQVNLSDAYCQFNSGELWIENLYIKEYDFGGTHFNHVAKKSRKLLLHRKELKKLERGVSEKGFTIVPYRLYVNDRGFIKVEIALARGKKSFDKRNSIREKDISRDMDRLDKFR